MIISYILSALEEAIPCTLDVLRKCQSEVKLKILTRLKEGIGLATNAIFSVPSFLLLLSTFIFYIEFIRGRTPLERYCHTVLGKCYSSFNQIYMYL